jgi:hypothetical protein
MTLTALSHLLMVVQRPPSRLPLSPTAARPYWRLSYWRLYDLRIASVVDVVNEFERDVVIDFLDDLELSNATVSISLHYRGFYLALALARISIRPFPLIRRVFRVSWFAIAIVLCLDSLKGFIGIAVNYFTLNYCIISMLGPYVRGEYSSVDGLECSVRRRL